MPGGPGSARQISGGEANLTPSHRGRGKAATGPPAAEENGADTRSTGKTTPETRRGAAPISAGCLVTRGSGPALEVLLVHPRGASFRRPLFGIPKGIVEPGEDLIATALRETFEETGLRVRVHRALGSVRQKAGKQVYAFWATVAPDSLDSIDEQGRCIPADRENDVCRFYRADRARDLMIPAQCEFLDRLLLLSDDIC